MPQNHTPGHVQEHIELIAKHEQEFLAKRTPSEKVGDAVATFVGSLKYVLLNVAFLIIWILWNEVPIRSLAHFDPAPFPLLNMLFAFEAILVASFIVMRQARIGRRSEEREQLMLQILLLSERETTAILTMERKIAERMGLHKIAADQEITELSEQTSIDEVAQFIKESLPLE
jgi:uncharacterized membrane protein